MKNGFRRSGLFPFDLNAVDYSKCVKDQLPSKKTFDHESAIHTDDRPSLHYVMHFIEKHIGDA